MTIFLFRSGIGLRKAYEVSECALGAEHWDLVISSGFAGALKPCAIGTLVVARDVITDGDDRGVYSVETTIIPCDQDFGNTAFMAACAVDATSVRGRMATVPRIVVKATEKQEIAARTEAVALDMESAMLGQVAAQKLIPFIVVRTISDLVHEDLPVDFNQFLYPQGWVRGLIEVISKPASLLAFGRLRRQTQKASQQMTSFFLKFFDVVDHVSPQRGSSLESMGTTS